MCPARLPLPLPPPSPPLNTPPRPSATWRAARCSAPTRRSPLRGLHLTARTRSCARRRWGAATFWAAVRASRVCLQEFGTPAWARMPRACSRADGDIVKAAASRRADAHSAGACAVWSQEALASHRREAAAQAAAREVLEREARDLRVRRVLQNSRASGAGWMSNGKRSTCRGRS
jgi:hypothetical protein